MLSSFSPGKNPLSGHIQVKIADSDPYFDLYQTIHSLIKESDTDGELTNMQLPLKGEAIAGYCSDSSYFAAAVLLRVHHVKASQIFIHQLNQLLPNYGLNENYGHVVLYIKDGGELVGLKNHDVFFDATSTQFNGRLNTSPGDCERLNVYRNLCEFGEDGRTAARELVCRGYILIPSSEEKSEKLGMLLAAYQENGSVGVAPKAQLLELRGMYVSSLDVPEPLTAKNIREQIHWKLHGDWRSKFYQITSRTGVVSSPLFLINHSGARDYNERKGVPNPWRNGE